MHDILEDLYIEQREYSNMELNMMKPWWEILCFFYVYI